MKYQAVAISLLLPLCGLPISSARADIGAVGSPVEVSNVADAASTQSEKIAAQSAQETVPAESRKPVLVIRFNQRHVYFERALKQAVDAVEKAKPDASFDLVSYLPVSASHEQGQRTSQDAASNVGLVVSALQNMGIPASQIHTSTQSGQPGSVQEIDIFVQ